MHKRSVGRIGAMSIALGAALAWADGANAAGAVNISSCQTLSTPNTVYRLTTDLTSCSTCLVVAGNRITIDLQAHSVTSTCPPFFIGPAITDQGVIYDSIVVKNGAVSGFAVGLHLRSTRVSVIGVEANNGSIGIYVVGAHSLIKSSVARNNRVFGILADGDRTQVQQCDASNNGETGMVVGAHCLVTMNTANNNGLAGIFINGGGGDCTVSFNTTNNNGSFGITTEFSNAGDLITHHTAMGNGGTDFRVLCPSDVTFNTSSGLPTSYQFLGSPPCHTAHNN